MTVTLPVTQLTSPDRVKRKKKEKKKKIKEEKWAGARSGTMRVQRRKKKERAQVKIVE